MTDLELLAFEVRGRFDRLGYSIFAEAVEGSEMQFWQELKEAARKLEKEHDWVNSYYRTRGTSQRSLEYLHKHCPEPAWGVRCRKAYY